YGYSAVDFWNGLPRYRDQAASTSKSSTRGCTVWLASALERRSAPRLALLFLGAVLAPGPAQHYGSPALHRWTPPSWSQAARTELSGAKVRALIWDWESWRVLNSCPVRGSQR